MTFSGLTFERIKPRIGSVSVSDSEVRVVLPYDDEAGDAKSAEVTCPCESGIEAGVMAVHAEKMRSAWDRAVMGPPDADGFVLGIFRGPHLNSVLSSIGVTVFSPDDSARFADGRVAVAKIKREQAK